MTAKPIVGGRWSSVLILLAAAAPATAGELRVRLDAAGGVRNDGNYLQVDQERAGLTNPESPDTRSVAAGGFDLNLSYALRTLELALTYSPWREEDLDDSDRSRINDRSTTNHRLDFALDGNLTRRTRLRVRERLLAAPGLDVAPTFAADTVATPRRSDQLRHNLDLGLTTDLSRKNAVRFEARHSLLDFDQPTLVDTWTAGGGAGWIHRFDDRRRTDASLGVMRFDFEGRTADVATLGLAYEVEVVEDAQLRFLAGAFAVDSQVREILDDGTSRSAGDRQNGWRGAIAFSRLGERLSWNLRAGHDVAAGYGLGQPTEVDSALAGISMPAGRRLVFGLDASASRQRVIEGLEGLDGDEAMDPERAETRFAVGSARASWSFADWGRLNGTYSRVWQESEVPQFADLSYDRYFVGLALRLWSRGAEPKDPARQGQEVEDDEERGAEDAEPVDR